jgi:hypothetical protein
MKKVELVKAVPLWPSRLRIKLRRPGETAARKRVPARWWMRSEKRSKPLRKFCDLFWVVFRQISGRRGAFIADVRIRVKIFMFSGLFRAVVSGAGCERFTYAGDMPATTVGERRRSATPATATRFNLVTLLTPLKLKSPCHLINLTFRLK